jgi:hypothetical protein
MENVHVEEKSSRSRRRKKNRRSCVRKRCLCEIMNEMLYYEYRYVTLHYAKWDKIGRIISNGVEIVWNSSKCIFGLMLDGVIVLIGPNAEENLFQFLITSNN